MKYGAGYKDDRAPKGRAIVKNLETKVLPISLPQFQPFCSFWLL